jgi:hypothetical protein
MKIRNRYLLNKDGNPNSDNLKIGFEGYFNTKNGYSIKDFISSFSGDYFVVLENDHRDNIKINVKIVGNEYNLTPNEIYFKKIPNNFADMYLIYYMEN